jgi:hypothetical protein
LDTTYGESLRQRQESMFLLKSALKAVTESASDILAEKQSEDLPANEKEELSKAIMDASAAALSKVCQTKHLGHANCLFMYRVLALLLPQICSLCCCLADPSSSFCSWPHLPHPIPLLLFAAGLASPIPVHDLLDYLRESFSQW